MLPISAAAEERSLVLPENTGSLTLGAGINSLATNERDLVRGKCISFKVNEANPNYPSVATLTGGLQPVVSFFMKEVNSESELDTVINNSFGLGGKANIYGVKVAADVKHRFRLTKEQDETNKYVLIAILVELGATSYAGIPEPEPASLLLLEKSPSEFFKSCGDAFISSYTSHAFFIGVVTVEAKSNKELKEWTTDASTSASWSDYGGNANTKIDKSVSSVLKTYNLETNVFVNGKLSNAKITTADELRKAATDFLVSAQQTGGSHATSVTVIDYGSVPAYANKRLMSVVDSEKVVARFRRLRDEAEEQSRLVDLLREEPNLFQSPVPEEQRSAWALELAKFIDKINTAHSACANAPQTDCKMETSVTLESGKPRIEMPPKIKEYRSDPLCGVADYERTSAMVCTSSYGSILRQSPKSISFRVEAGKAGVVSRATGWVQSTPRPQIKAKMAEHCFQQAPFRLGTVRQPADLNTVCEKAIPTANTENTLISGALAIGGAAELHENFVFHPGQPLGGWELGTCFVECRASQIQLASDCKVTPVGDLSKPIYRVCLLDAQNVP
jgi:hypothetical protein